MNSKDLSADQLKSKLLEKAKEKTQQVKDGQLPQAQADHLLDWLSNNVGRLIDAKRPAPARGALSEQPGCPGFYGWGVCRALSRYIFRGDDGAR